MKIIEKNTWSPESVRRVCSKCDLFKKGSIDDYNYVLDEVRRMPVTVDNIYNVAGFISKYSDDAPVDFVMRLLRKNAVETNYEIKEGEGK
jgi:hypothetical protein